MVQNGRSDDAVSSVIGTVLMLGITVSVFAGVSIVVLNQFNEQDATPHSSLTILRGDAAYLLQHKGGDPIALDSGFVRVGTPDFFLDFPLTDFAGDTADGSNWRLGETLCVTCALPGQTPTGAYLVVAGTLLASEGAVTSVGLVEGTDFTVRDPSVEPAIPIEARAATFRAVVVNAGKVTDTAILEVRVDGVSIGTDSASIAGGSIATLSVPWTADTSGAHTVTFLIDADGLIPEADESNNLATLPVAITPSVPDPGFPYLDDDLDGRYTEGLDTAIAPAEVQDGTYDAGPGNLVVPASSSPISAPSITYQGAHVTVHADLTAQTGSILLGADDDLVFDGTATAQASGQTLTLTSGGQTDIHGATLTAPGSMSVAGGSINATGTSFTTTVDGRDVALTATSGNILLDDATVQTLGLMTVNAAGSISAQRIDVDVPTKNEDVTWTAGTRIDATDADIVAHGHVTLTATTGDIQLDGLTLAMNENGKTLTATAGGTLTATAGTSLTTRGPATLQGASATLDGMSLTNTAGSGDLLLHTTTGTLSAAGTTISSNGHITLRGATNVDASGATMTVTGGGKDLQIEALGGDVDVQGATFTVTDRLGLTVPDLSRSVLVEGATFADANNAADVTPNGAATGTPASGGIE